MLTSKQILGLMLSSALLTGCGSDSDSSTSVEPVKPTPPQPVINEQGRLVIANADTVRPVLTVYDLKQQKNIYSATLKVLPNAMYSSPSNRYAVMLSRAEGLVQFADGGIFTQKNQIQVNAPAILSYQLMGAAPTHFRSFQNLATIFYDGSDAESSKFMAFTDTDIEKKTVATQSLPKKHHGVAEPRGNTILSTYLSTNEEILSLVKSYGLHGDHFHEEQTLKNACSKLHGAGSNSQYTLFGCVDGVLVVEQKNGQFLDYKMSLDQRISTIVGHEKIAEFVVFASGTGDAFVIDPKSRRATSLNWSQGAKESDGITPVKRLQHVMSATGQYFIILDSTGVVHIVNTATWVVKAKVKVIESVVTEELAKSRLVINSQADTLFINDTVAKKIIEVDIKTAKIKQQIQLTDIPQTFTWLGVPKKTGS